MHLPSKSSETDAELLTMATHFELLSYDRGGTPGQIYSVAVERRTSVSDPVRSWAITDNMNFCLNRDGEWEYEPQPSSRNDQFLQRCRWSDLREAIAFAKAHMAKHPSGYKPETDESK